MDWVCGAGSMLHHSVASWNNFKYGVDHDKLNNCKNVKILRKSNLSNSYDIFEV